MDYVGIGPVYDATKTKADAAPEMGLAGFAAIMVASTLGPLNLNTVVIASLLVLLPGMAITNAVNELTSQHLVSGTARFSGAVATVIKLTVGTMIALQTAASATPLLPTSPTLSVTAT